MTDIASLGMQSSESLPTHSHSHHYGRGDNLTRPGVISNAVGVTGDGGRGRRHAAEQQPLHMHVLSSATSSSKMGRVGLCAAAAAGRPGGSLVFLLAAQWGLSRLHNGGGKGEGDGSVGCG